MIRTTCAACGHAEPTIFLDLGSTPLANKFPVEADLDKERWYPLQLGTCGSCGLVQMMEVIDDSEIYGEDYGFYSGGSEAQLTYHHDSAQLLSRRHLQGNDDKFVVEIACNDGSLLKHFVNSNYRSLGIDPARPADVAIDAGLPVLKEPFTSELARTIRDDKGPADLIIAYNSMAHVSDLSDVFVGIWALLAPKGVAVIEVQYLPDLLVGNRIDQVYHEHRYFHSLTSLTRVAELHRLFVADAELIELQDGGIRVTLTPDPLVKMTRRAERILLSEQWLTADGAYVGVQGRVDRLRDHLMEILYREHAKGTRMAGYAAAAKATTILNFCGIGPGMIPFVVDTTPYKQGRFVPGMQIPITADGVGSVELLLLLAPNYLGPVVRNHPEFLDRGGKWLVPVPSPVLI